LNINTNEEIHRKNKVKQMNKADLVNEISSKTGLTKTKTGEVIDTIVESIQGALATGDKVTLVGFGTFDTITRKARKGRNPKTGAELNIPSKRAARFKAGTGLSNVVNS
jgi:DNA-binding protein HU-beta